MSAANTNLSRWPDPVPTGPDGNPLVKCGAANVLGFSVPIPFAFGPDGSILGFVPPWGGPYPFAVHTSDGQVFAANAGGA
jgi:hypothetical protein